MNKTPYHSPIHLSLVPRPFLLCACLREGRKGLYTPARILGWNAKGVRMQHNYPISAHRVKERARDGASLACPDENHGGACTRSVHETIVYSMHTPRISPAQAREAIAAFVSGNDVFVSLPIGHGKSFCYVLLPLVFDELLQEWFGCAYCRNRVKHATYRIRAGVYHQPSLKHAHKRKGLAISMYIYHQGGRTSLRRYVTIT